MTCAAFQVWLEGQWDRDDQVGEFARFVDRVDLRLPSGRITPGDLADVWVRVLRDCDRRAGGIRTAVRLRSCSCADGGQPGAEGRCERCFGRSGAERERVVTAS